MPAPLSRLLYKALDNPHRPRFDPGNPHYISPTEAAHGLNRLPWELPFQGITAVLWPADPAPVAVLPGDDHACLRFHPLTKPAFPATTRLKGNAVITHNLGLAAERLGASRKSTARLPTGQPPACLKATS